MRTGVEGSAHLAIRATSDQYRRKGQMGYHAPSAEEVYRHAFRLDRAWSLTDRFGFSIVLVNDNSLVCREFLKRYCLDLCLRTADRIRFVFFSELPERDFQAVANDMNRGRGEGSQGMLGRVLGMLDERSSLDYENEPWMSMRPPALRPLRHVDDIERQLSWECDTRTAMPGTGIAMRFAQRIGVGRHVPCVLVFTEIGELYVDLLPIASRSADEVFAHIREWIDTFYEKNRPRIDHWRAVEDDIERRVRNARSTLAELGRWRDERLNDWRRLVTISGAIHEIESGDRDRWERLCEESSSDYSAPIGMREVFSWLRDALRGLDARQSEISTIERAIREVEGAESPQLLLDLLTRLRDGLPASVAPLGLRDAVDSLGQGQAPWRELRAWWFSSGGLKLSLAPYKRARAAWATLPLRSRLKHREEYRLVLDALARFPLTVDPAQGADAVFQSLAQALGLDPASDSFRSATDTYRGVVRDFIGRAAATAPTWLLAHAPGITIGEAVPLGEDWSPANASRALDGRPTLREALERAAAGGEEDLARRRREAAVRWREHVLAELRAAKATRLIPEPALLSIRDKALMQLQSLRLRLEASALTLVSKVPATGPPLDRGQAARLHEALDEYDQVVTSIVFPHRNDPAVIRVPLNTPLTVAAGVGAERVPGKTAQLRSSLAEASGDHEQATYLRAQAQAQVAKASPASRLEAALQSGLGDHRAAAVAPDVARTLAEHRTCDLLRSLTDRELRSVAEALGSSAETGAVLTALGLYAGGGSGLEKDARAQELAAKIPTDQFDVFLAHNSRDKDAVLEIARRLRQEGIHPWIDVEQIPPGRWFQDAIQAAIPRVGSAAVVLGHHGLGQWQALELRGFVSQCVERKLPVIPVLLPGVKEMPSDLLFLRELSAVKFTAGLEDEHAIGRLVWGIRGRRPGGI
jgi:hypothetical protein